jgi:hypothetical protein
MKTSDLSLKNVLSVVCPTCGVPRRKRCVLNTGTLRSGPHLDRKFLAAEALEKKGGR